VNPNPFCEGGNPLLTKSPHKILEFPIKRYILVVFQAKVRVKQEFENVKGDGKRGQFYF